MNEQFGFKLPDGATREDVEAALAETYAFVVEEPVAGLWCFYDTFDWRLFSRSLLFRRSSDEYTLALLAGGEDLRCEVGLRQPVFAWDFPQGELRTALEPILQERALLTLANVPVEETTYRILDDEQKTVARLVCSRVQAESGAVEMSPAVYLSVRPLRGYMKDARRLARRLAVGEAVPSVDQAIYARALELAEQTPKSYTGQLDVHLDPAMPAGEATRAILRQLLETMRANEAGIRADIDTEFLHDYRVAIRRTRSALGQIRNVFPAETTERFKQDFRALGTLTNELRDLDVYLLAEPDYRAMLPEALRDDISPLFSLLRSRRADALDHVIQGLDSERYQRFVADWEAFITGPGGDDASAVNAGVPIIALARKRIYQRYRRIVRDGSYILEHTEDELLHALRIECKKLRYLLEFFASLFPSKEMSKMIRQLKRLQDNLGEFTDLEVQQRFLLSVAEALDMDDAGTRRALVATGALVETMARRQQDVKANFAETFREFASPAHRKQFRKLCAREE
jgi:CHAD domain-containing protein